MLSRGSALLAITFLAAGSAASEGVDDLAAAGRRAAKIVAERQDVAGYWLTLHTRSTRFENPSREMNTSVTAALVDVLDPVARSAGLEENLRHARRHLAAQIEPGGLVRYHGRPDGPTIGTLGCVITPDSDDTALVWRIAPGRPVEGLTSALAVIEQYRTPAGLYRTWLAPRERYACIDPGRDPNPPDVCIQMDILLFLAKVDPPAARNLCAALGRAIADDGIWVYYEHAPLVPAYRVGDLRKAGCVVPLPASRQHSAVPGQDIWVQAALLLERVSNGNGAAAARSEAAALLRELARDDFAAVRKSPPLLYHNDLTASTSRYYWSEEFGYALWLRLFFESTRRP